MNWELPDVQAGFRKGRGNRDQITNTHWIIEKARGYLKKKNLLLLHWLHLILWLCGSQQTVENFSGDGNTRPPTCLLRSLYAGQKATVTTRHGTRNWFQIGKELLQDSILSPCLFNLQSEYIMQNTGLYGAQARIKIGGKNINNLRYTDDTILMAESEEELKCILMKAKEESEKAGLKLSIQKMRIMASSLITSWQIDGKNWKQ